MAAAILTLDGKKFVVVPAKEYRALLTTRGAVRAARQAGTRASKRSLRAGAGKRPSRKASATDPHVAGDVAESRRRLAEPGRRVPAHEVLGT